MSISRLSPPLIAGVFLCMSWIACSTAPAPDDANTSHFHDLASAPLAIQTAAKAVVRVATAGQSGTGAFISATGLLLTNNHVLGVPVCPVEGCGVELTFGYERGGTMPMSTDLVATPVAVDVGLDMAIVQIAHLDGSALTTPDFLTWHSAEASALLGTHVTIVGHPEGDLKKWTDGSVFDTEGSWLKTTAFILPGDSGSPVLDDGGAIVGLIHRSPVGEDLLTNTGANYYSIGSASEPLMQASKAPLPSVLLSIVADATSDVVVANDKVYLNNRTTGAFIGGQRADVLTLLGAACDTALARTDFASPDDLTLALTPCEDAMFWIECRADVIPNRFLPYDCPVGTDADAWRQRFSKMNQATLAMNGMMSLDGITSGVAALAPTMSAGNGAALTSLEQALASANPPLDFNLAYTLARYGLPTYAGTSISQYIVGYASVPEYQDSAQTIGAAATWLGTSNLITTDAVGVVLTALEADPNVSIGAKLGIENIEYEWHLIQ